MDQHLNHNDIIKDDTFDRNEDRKKRKKRKKQKQTGFWRGLMAKLDSSKHNSQKTTSSKKFGASVIGNKDGKNFMK